MITIIGILVGAIIVGLIWIVVYFNQEISEIRSDMRASNHITYSQYYKSNYGGPKNYATYANKLHQLANDARKQTLSEEDWDNWKNSLCTECLEKIKNEEEEE